MAKEIILRLRLVRIIFNFVTNAKNYLFSENSYKWTIISWSWIQKCPNRSIQIHQVILLGPLRSLTLIIDLGSRQSGPPCFQEAISSSFSPKIIKSSYIVIKSTPVVLQSNFSFSVEGMICRIIQPWFSEFRILNFSWAYSNACFAYLFTLNSSLNVKFFRPISKTRPFLWITPSGGRKLCRKFIWNVVKVSKYTVNLAKSPISYEFSTRKF